MVETHSTISSPISAIPVILYASVWQCSLLTNKDLTILFPIKTAYIVRRLKPPKVLNLIENQNQADIPLYSKIWQDWNILISGTLFAKWERAEILKSKSWAARRASKLPRKLFLSCETIAPFCLRYNHHRLILLLNFRFLWRCSLDGESFRNILTHIIVCILENTLCRNYHLNFCDL